MGADLQGFQGLSSKNKGEGSWFLWFSGSEFDSGLQIGAAGSGNSVSSLSLWERARVRGLLNLPHKT
jgi:hypothetical protein